MTRGSGDAHFLVRPIYLAQCIAYLADGCVGAYSIDDVGHSVRVGHFAVGFYDRLLRCGFLERFEAALNLLV